MTLHYHGTPISPASEMLSQMQGCHFCVSYADARDVERAHKIGQSVLLDNGAFSHWRLGKKPDWPGYYSWTDQWLDHPTTWAIIPDIIQNATEEDQERLIHQWPHGERGAPVWHLHESIDRLLGLLSFWPKVCFGSSGQYAEVLSVAWQRRVDEAWNEIAKRHQRTPWVHMLRGMQLCNGWPYPFASLDSTDIGRNFKNPQNGYDAQTMARRWDQKQCPSIWLPREQLALEGGFYEREAAQ